MKPKLTEQDFIEAAEQLGCDVAAIKAVAEVESLGGGFLSNDQPKILFEAHVFGRLTNYKYNRSHPTLSATSWKEGKGHYKGGAAEHARLAAALKLDRQAALQSASWGKFQVLGENWKLCGYPSLDEFVRDMYEGEAGHLRAFVGFVKGKHLDDELRRHKWDAFALGYNGKGYKANNYDTKMASAYRRYKALEAIPIDEDDQDLDREAVLSDEETWHPLEMESAPEPIPIAEPAKPLPGAQEVPGVRFAALSNGLAATVEGNTASQTQPKQPADESTKVTSGTLKRIVASIGGACAAFSPWFEKLTGIDIPPETLKWLVIFGGVAVCLGIISWVVIDVVKLIVNKPKTDAILK